MVAKCPERRVVDTNYQLVISTKILPSIGLKRNLKCWSTRNSQIKNCPLTVRDVNNLLLVSKIMSWTQDCLDFLRGKFYFQNTLAVKCPRWPNGRTINLELVK